MLFMKKTALFIFLCVITFLFFINSISGIFRSNIPVLNIIPAYNPMNVIVEAGVNMPNDIMLKANGEFFQIPPYKDLLNKSLNGNIKTLSVYVKENFEKNIKRIVIFNDLKMFYFNDFSEFKKGEENLCFQNECINYTTYDVPNYVKYNQNSNSFNFKTNLHLLSTALLSLFQFNLSFVIPYILLFITIIYFINSKDGIKLFKINGYVVFALLFVIGILLRYDGLFNYLPWEDEYWSVEFANPDKPFLNTFLDPGNPPFFYIILRLWITLFGISDISIRILPFTIGIFSIFSVWFVLYKNIDLKTANTGAFLSVFNLSLIYYSNEVRSYILQIALVPFITYFLFKILKEEKTKDCIIYAILTAVICNTHYYGILFVFFNYIYGIVYFIFKKKKKFPLKFILTGVVAAVTFLPYFLYTSYSKAMMNATFNAWIPDINFEQIKKCVLYLFGGILSFILSLVFFVQTLKKPSSKEKELLIYLFLAIFAVLFQAITVSYILRPIFVEKYLTFLIPLFIMYLSILFNRVNLKYGIILFIIWALCFFNAKGLKNNQKQNLTDSPVIMAYEWNKTFPNDNVYVITNLSGIKYLKCHREYVLEKIQYIQKSPFETEDTINEIMKKDKKAIIFTSILNSNSDKIRTNDNYSCFFNTSSDLCLWRIKND